MSIERFADDVAELIDRVAGGGPVDVWGFSLGALTATSLALRHPAKVRRLVLAASNIRPDGYHPEITAPEQDDPRLPTEEEFAAWQADYEAVAPNPADFFPFLERMQPVVHDFAGWTADEIRSITAPTFLVIGDRDFVRLDHAAEMLDLFPDCRLAVLPAHPPHRGHAARRRAAGARQPLPLLAHGPDIDVVIQSAVRLRTALEELSTGGVWHERAVPSELSARPGVRLPPARP